MKASQRKGYIPRELYAQFHAAMPILCVDVLVIHAGKVLLLKRAIEPEKGKWWLPGGRLLRGESLRSAVIRIVRDEAGLKAEPLSIITHLEYQSAADPFGHGRGTCTVSVVYSCGILGGKLRFDRNHTAARWWDGVDGREVPPVICTLVNQFLGGSL